MKKFTSIVAFCVISFSSSCNKKTVRVPVARGEVAAHPGASMESSATSHSEPTSAGRGDLVFLHRMCGCPVGYPGFIKRKVDYTISVGWKPQRNAFYHYGVGEDQFFTKHWKEALLAFELAKDHSGNDTSKLRDLIDFKIMLCVAGLGMDDQFDQLVSMNLAADGRPLSGYTKVAKEFYAGNVRGAGEVLAKIKTIFPSAEIRAPWEETLAEFGYTLADHQE